MISVIHAPADPAAEQDEDVYRIPAGGRRMEMDWDAVACAFRKAVAHVGWDADLEIRPEKQYVMVRLAAGRPGSVAAAMDEFYDHVEESVGTDAFRSIWIDFSFRH